MIESIDEELRGGSETEHLRPHKYINNEKQPSQVSLCETSDRNENSEKLKDDSKPEEAKNAASVRDEKDFG